MQQTVGERLKACASFMRLFFYSLESPTLSRYFGVQSLKNIHPLRHTVNFFKQFMLSSRLPDR